MSSPPAPEAEIAALTSTFSSNNADINAAFTLNSGYLVFFMHCGFAMLSIGCVRAKFAKHISILILVDACASALGYYLFGYAFAFGDRVDANGYPSGNAFIGSQYFALHGLPPGQLFLWLFQWSFAATACTIVSGAIAERARFESYILYSFFMAAWVYPVLTHSGWSQAGWASPFRNSPNFPTYLFGSGAIDYAGSGAVHMVGGTAALVGCAILGPRIGRFLPDGTVVDMAGHNTSLFVLGVMILWFGWYGFNPGSQLAITGGASQAVANAAITTTLAPAAAGLSGMAFRTILTKVETGRVVYDLMTMGNAALAGLVAITSGCSVILPWGALVVGGVAGCLYVIGSKVSVMLRLDDPLDAIAVHFWNGTWGVIAVGFLAGENQVRISYGLKQSSYSTANADCTDTANPAPECLRDYGCWLGGNGALLAAQCVYALWLFAWVATNMAIFFTVINLLGLFRVDPSHETTGLDDSYHGGSAYPGGPEEETDKSLRGATANKAVNGGAAGGASRAEIDEIKAELAMLKSSVKTQSLA